MRWIDVLNRLFGISDRLPPPPPPPGHDPVYHHRINQVQRHQGELEAISRRRTQAEMQADIYRRRAWDGGEGDAPDLYR